MGPVPSPEQPLPDEFGVALARCAGRLGGFASRVIWHETVSSTNDVAERAAAAGAAHGTVVAAGGQSSGRGRAGRAWFSPAGAGLYVSVVLRPDRLVESAGEARIAGAVGRRREAGTTDSSRVGQASEGGDGGATDGSHVGQASWLAGGVTLTAGVALADAVRTASGLSVAIRWPNDLVVGQRKLGGILAEAVASGDAIRHVILGFGINVHAAVSPPELADRATSIEAELGRPVDGGLVFAESLACLAERLRELANDGFCQILDRWRNLSPSSVGRRVEVTAPGGWTAATTAGVDQDGALLADVNGTIRRVIAGEVRWS